MPILHWLNRETSIKETSRVPYRLLKADDELSYGDSETENMLIQGDNLDALKALLPYYAGKVKCIFIDPPYNTQNAFEHYDDNLEHTKWLEMMYPRLELLRELLSEDGSIWVTIDDNESHYLKVIMDEIFGRKNFVANCIWQKKYTVANDARYFSDNHDHIMSFAKNKEIWQPNPLLRTDAMNERFKNPDDHHKGVWKATPLHAKSGKKTSQKFSYAFKNGILWSPPEGTFPRFSIESLKKLDESNEIWFGSKGDAIPSRKTFLSELKSAGVTPRTIWLHDEVGHNHEAKTEIRNLNFDEMFDTPKPERLIQRILHLATNPVDLVLDSFLGSGTTAAVAHKMGRRYIGIEMGDHAKTHCAVRLQKVIDGDQSGVSKDVNWTGGGGFRFYYLGEAIFDDAGHINPGIRFQELAAHIWFSETRKPYIGKADSPLLGVYNDVAYYLLYNGILGDKRPQGGNVLTSKTLADLPPYAGSKVVYGETNRLGVVRLAEHQITFKQTPYDIKAR